MDVLFIAVDDMNDWVEPLGGHSQAITPNIQTLADKGMLFTNAHVSSPACHPSRVALMTGVQPEKSGVKQNVFAKGEVTWRRSPALKEATTLSQHFRDNGYEAIAGGKIYHTLQGNPSDENDYSTWDAIMPGDPKSGSPIAFQPRAKKRNVSRQDEVGLSPNGIMAWAPMDVDSKQMADNKLVNWAIDELNKERDKPLFMAVGIFRPHLPWEVPKQFFDLYPIDTVQVPEAVPNELSHTYDHGRRHWHKWVADNNLWRSGVQAYLASISFADYEVGRLMAALEASGRADNTIVVFWSDHGMHIGEKENWEKFTLFEESTRIPMIIVDPREKPGQTHAPSSSIDLFPTLIELTDTRDNTHQTLDGESLADLVRGGHTDVQPAISSFQKVHSVRSLRYRYIFDQVNLIETLYDHNTDAQERINIAYTPAMRDVMQQHRDLLTAQTGIVPPKAFNVPKGFEVDTRGMITRRNFKPLHQVMYRIPGWWSDAKKSQAIERLKAQQLPYVQEIQKRNQAIH